MFWRRKKQSPNPAPDDQAHRQDFSRRLDALEETSGAAPVREEDTPPTVWQPPSELPDEFYFDAEELQTLSSAVMAAGRPPVSDYAWPLDGASRLEELSAAALAQAQSEEWQAAGIELLEQNALRLVGAELLEIPLLARTAEQTLWVFVYARASAEASGHYARVQALAQHAGARAVYVSPTPLLTADAQGAEPLPDLLPSALTLPLLRWDQALPPGDYLMWQPSDAAERLASSQEGKYLSQIYAAQDAAGPLLYGLLSRQLAWAQQPSEQFGLPLPQTTVYLPVSWHGQAMMLSAHQERGVRFHFPASSFASPVGLAQRLELLERVSRALDLLSQAAQVAGVLEAAPLGTTPSAWWQASLQMTDLRLDIGDDLSSIQVGSVRQEERAEQNL